MSASTIQFNRVLIKLSGEALNGDRPSGLDGHAIRAVARRIAKLNEIGLEVAVVVGGGNFFRGLASSAGAGIHRTTGDNIGMLATMMNGLALRDGMEACGIEAELMTAKPMPGIGRVFCCDEARRLLGSGKTLVFAGGTGCPFFTTDTTAALRACEIEADAILKATKVDGVYSADPEKDATAVRYRKLAYQDALHNRLGVMDSTAFSLCMDNEMPILVFDFNDPESLEQIVSGDFARGTLVGPVKTEIDSKT
jgi:uridylate kinase